MPNINEFKSRLRGGGARANQFKVTLPFPGYASVGGETSDLSFFCTATGIPGQDIPVVTVNFRGRQLKLAGDSRTFGSWNMTILNDTDFKIYRAFERWMNGINNMTDNEGLTNPNDYQVDGFIDHLDRDGNSIKQYVFTEVLTEPLKKFQFLTLLLVILSIFNKETESQLIAA